MKTLGGILIGLIVILLFVGLSWSLGFGRLFYNRQAMPYAETTRQQTYDHSQSYEQGTQNNFADLCIQMKTATDVGAKAMIQDELQHRLKVYTGPRPLSPEVESCLAAVEQ